MNVEERIDWLRNEISYHNVCYYANNDPKISDYEFDTLFRELEDLEEANPELATPDSPTQTVGATEVDWERYRSRES